MRHAFFFIRISWRHVQCKFGWQDSLRKYSLSSVDWATLARDKDECSPCHSIDPADEQRVISVLLEKPLEESWTPLKPRGFLSGDGVEPWSWNSISCHCAEQRLHLNLIYLENAPPPQKKNRNGIMAELSSKNRFVRTNAAPLTTQLTLQDCYFN